MKEVLISFVRHQHVNRMFLATVRGHLELDEALTRRSKVGRWRLPGTLELSKTVRDGTEGYNSISEVSSSLVV